MSSSRHLDDLRLANFRSRLEAARDRLIDDVTSLKNEAGAAEGRPQEDPADGATEEFVRDLTFGEAELSQGTLEEIDAALRRIEQGTYGICEATGRPIPLERLRAIPWARYARAAQEEIERENPGRTDLQRARALDDQT